MPSTLSRRWGLALAASVAVHAAALVGALGLFYRRAAPAKPVARTPAAAVFTRVSLSGAARRAPVTVASSSSSSSGFARARPRLSAPGSPALPVAPLSAGPSAGEPDQPVAGAATGEAAAEVSVGGDGTLSPQAMGGSVGGELERTGGSHGAAAVVAQVDLNALVHAQLARLAERCYPPAARRFRQEGVVGVRFCVDEVGAVKSTELVQSSRSPLLDGAATGCVVPQAAPFTAPAYGHCFAVPVHFGATR